MCSITKQAGRTDSGKNSLYDIMRWNTVKVKLIFEHVDTNLSSEPLAAMYNGHLIVKTTIFKQTLCKSYRSWTTLYSIEQISSAFVFERPY